jgi:hypothetical protein
LKYRLCRRDEAIYEGVAHLPPLVNILVGGDGDIQYCLVCPESSSTFKIELSGRFYIGNGYESFGLNRIHTFIENCQTYHARIPELIKIAEAKIIAHPPIFDDSPLND